MRTYAFVFETSGTAAAFDIARKAVSTSGKVVLIGQGKEPVTFTTRDMVQRQLTVQGSLIYDHPTDFATVVQRLPTSTARLGSVIQDCYPPVHAALAFAQARKSSGKSWIDFSCGWGAEAVR